MTISNRVILLSTGGAASMILSGCVGSATGGSATGTMLAPISGTNVAAAPAAVITKNKTYNALGSRSAKTSVLTGSGITVDNQTYYATYITGEGGTLNGNTRSVSVGTYNSSGPNTLTLITISGVADTSGKVTSVNGDTLAPDTSINQKGYDYVGIADSYTKQGTDTFSGLHVLGVATHPNDMPTTGKATYYGPAVVQGATKTANIPIRWVLTRAKARVLVNFGSGKVNTTITAPLGSNAPLNKISVTGANILITTSGTLRYFSGGTVKTSLGAKDVSTAYSDPKTSSNIGQFMAIIKQKPET